MEERKIRYYHTRFNERLPLKGEADIEYIKSKNYFLVEKFIEEYFSFEKNVFPNVVLDRSFAALASGIDEFDFSDMDDFQKGLSFLVIASVNLMGGRLKVSEDFFVEQFINSFGMRTVSFTVYTMDHSDFILNGLKSVGISLDESIDLLEAAMDSAEAMVEYSYSEKSYINSLVNELVKLAKGKGILLTKQILLPQEFA